MEILAAKANDAIFNPSATVNDDDDDDGNDDDPGDDDDDNNLPQVPPTQSALQDELQNLLSSISQWPHVRKHDRSLRNASDYNRLVNKHGYLMLVILVSVQLLIKEYEKSCANFFVYQKSSFESVLDDWQLFQKCLQISQGSI